MTKVETTKYGYPAIEVGLELGEQLVLVKKDKYGDNLVYCSSSEKLKYKFTYNKEKTKAMDMMVFYGEEFCGLIANFDYWYVDRIGCRTEGGFECI